MTKEIVDALLADYRNGLSNQNFGASTKFPKRSIIRGIRTKTGDIEKERPLLILTDTEKYNVELLTNHLVAAPIHTRPYNDYSIPILLNFYGDNSSRLSFVDPILELEILYFENFPKAVTKTQTCPDSVFDLVMEVKKLVLDGNHEKAKDLVKSYRLLFMKEHGIVSIGYILTKEKMKHLDIDGRERLTPPTIQGWEVLFYHASEYYTGNEVQEEPFSESPDTEEVPEEDPTKEEHSVPFYRTEMNDALKKALEETPLEEPVEESDSEDEEVIDKVLTPDSKIDSNVLKAVIEKESRKGKSPKSKRKAKATKGKKSKYAKKGFASAKMTDEELVNFMTVIETASNPSDAKAKLFGFEDLSAGGFSRRYQSVCKEMEKRNMGDMIIPWDFDDPTFKNHWTHRAKVSESESND